MIVRYGWVFDLYALKMSEINHILFRNMNFPSISIDVEKNKTMLNIRIWEYVTFNIMRILFTFYKCLTW